MATPTTLPATFVAGNVLTAAQMNDLRGAFRVLQVVSVAKTDTFTTSSTSLVDVTGLTASITPSATSSLVLVMVSLSMGNDTAGANSQGVLVRGSTAIAIGDTASNRTRSTFMVGTTGANNIIFAPMQITFLDSPATTSSTAYKIQVRSGSNTTVVNRGGRDTDNATDGRGISTITLFEVSA